MAAPYAAPAHAVWAPAGMKGESVLTHYRSHVRRLCLALVTAGLLAGLMLPGALGAVAAQGPPPLHNYRIDGVSTKEQRTAIARTGASIEAIAAHYVLIRATDQNVSAIRALGFHTASYVEPNDFPPADSNYHSYAEMVNDVNAEVAAHPTLIKKLTIGQSYEGRNIIAALITKNADTYTSGRPEVLYDGLHHAREHLTVEETLSIMHLFVDKYGSNAQTTKLVNTRAIWHRLRREPGRGRVRRHRWLVPFLAQEPAAEPRLLGHRDGPQPELDSYRWGCCGGSSGNPADETDRGASVFSAPETQAIRDFVNSRVIGGVQRITSSISFHTFSEMVLWPYGYTFTDVPSDMTMKDHNVFVAIGEHIASTTCQAGDCYTPNRPATCTSPTAARSTGSTGCSKPLRLHHRDVPEHRPSRVDPPDEVIKAQTKRLQKAVLYVAKNAACPYKVIGQAC